MNNILTAGAHRVSPAFDGTLTLPRISDWAGLRERLLSQAQERDLDAGAFYQLAMGRRYAVQLSALALEPLGVAVRVEASAAGFIATLLLRSRSRAIEDRWEVEVDANGLLRDMRSEHRTAEGAYNADDFSRFFDLIIKTL
jgi:hypothetical protein